MPKPKTITITLVGALKGKTKIINGTKFEDGVYKYTGSEKNCTGLARYFSKAYQASVEGIDIGQPEPEVEVPAETLAPEAPAEPEQPQG